MKNCIKILTLLCLIFAVYSYGKETYSPYAGEDRYVSYIAVVDFNNGGQVLFIDREKLKYSFKRSASSDAESITYFKPARYLYTGGGTHITSVYASHITNKVSRSNMGDSCLVAANDDYLFALKESGNLTCYYPESNGSITEKIKIPVVGKGADMVSSRCGSYICVSATGESRRDITIVSGNGRTFLGCVPLGGNAGLAINEHLSLYAVDNAAHKLNLISPSTRKINKSIDLSAYGFSNPWGVACAGGKVYVCDHVASGKVAVFDYNLNHITTINDIGDFPRHMSGDPENQMAYVSCEGDKYGGKTFLIILDPANDSVYARISLKGHRPMGITVMPWSR